MGALETIRGLFNAALLASTLRMSTLILYPTLGGIFCSQSGVLNVGLEGLMLLGAFFAVVGSVATASPWGGVLFGVIACVLISLCFAAVHLEWGAQAMIVGLAMNLLGYGLTSYLLTLVFGAYGYYSSPEIVPFLPVHLALLERVPVLDSILSGHFLLVYLGFVAVGLTYLALYKTPWGFRLRSVGENPEAADAVGINVRAMKYAGVLIGGALSGVGGAFLSLGHLSLFSENMSAGRGFLALAAVNFGERRPLRCLGAVLVFGFADALATRLQQFGMPSQLVMMLPYVATIVTLTLSSVQRAAAKRARMTVRA